MNELYSERKLKSYKTPDGKIHERKRLYIKQLSYEALSATAKRELELRQQGIAVNVIRHKSIIHKSVKEQWEIVEYVRQLDDGAMFEVYGAEFTKVNNGGEYAIDNNGSTIPQIKEKHKYSVNLYFNDFRKDGKQASVKYLEEEDLFVPTLYLIVSYRQILNKMILDYVGYSTDEN